MMDMGHTVISDTITGLDAQGRPVATSMGSVLAIVPDHGVPTRTRLHVADGVILVDGRYEDWMETLAADWSSTRSEPFDPATIGLAANGLRWDAASHPILLQAV